MARKKTPKLTSVKPGKLNMSLQEMQATAIVAAVNMADRIAQRCNATEQDANDLASRLIKTVDDWMAAPGEPGDLEAHVEAACMGWLAERVPTQGNA